ncbi:MAG: diadenosine tetraphosphate hydrolase [Actinobacteria bacterium]|nr:diadenosine tetraphosphate hydrolase [Actinomycetota bacterium]
MPRRLRWPRVGGANLAAVQDWRADRVGAAIEGHNPTVLSELDSAFAVIGDVQFLPGYCLALTKVRGVDRLTDLPRAQRVRYLADVDLLATAVERVCAAGDGGFRRVNIEILGNTDPFLHAHVWPRYDWEPAGLVGKPVWLYPPENWQDPDHQLSAVHDPLRSALRLELAALARASRSTDTPA